MLLVVDKNHRVVQKNRWNLKRWICMMLKFSTFCSLEKKGLLLELNSLWIRHRRWLENANFRLAFTELGYYQSFSALEVFQNLGKFLIKTWNIWLTDKQHVHQSNIASVWIYHSSLFFIRLSRSMCYRRVPLCQWRQKMACSWWTMTRCMSQSIQINRMFNSCLDRFKP